MPALSTLAIFFQDNAVLTNDVHSLMIAEWIIAICVLLVILGLIIAALVVMSVVHKVEKKVDNVTKTFQVKGMPLIAQGQDLLTTVQEIVADLKPKIASVSSDVEHISGVVKSKVDEAGSTFTQVNGTVKDANNKTHAQVQRVNSMVSEALTTTEHVSRSIQQGIRVPVQKMAGWVAAAKASMETMAERIPFLHQVAPKVTRYPSKTTGSAAPGGPPFVPAPDAGREPL